MSTINTTQTKTDKSNWRLYAAAGAAAMAATSAADAAIITGSPNLTLSPGATKTFKIGAAKESAFIFVGTHGFDQSLTNPGLRGQLKVINSNILTANYVKNFNLGAPINVGAGNHLESAGYLHFRARPVFDTNTVATNSGGPISGAGKGYVGFELANGDKGWISVQLSNEGRDAEVLSYAYNDVPGGAINAGQTGAVPEPSALGLLAIGSAGVLAWRRRRNAPAR